MRWNYCSFLTIVVVSVSLVIIAGLSTSVAADKRLLRIATASTGGSWYPAGGAIGSIITKYVSNTEASAHPSAASRENIRLIQHKKSELGMVMPDVAFYARNAKDMYAGKDPVKISGLFSFWGIDLLIIARADTDIHEVEDLKGKRVGFGAPGSGSEKMSKKILAEYGISYDDLKPRFISATEQSRGLKDKSLDAAMYTIGTPAATFVDLCTLTKCRLIPIKEEMRKKILKKYPFYTASTIPAGAYPRIDYDTPTIKWLGLLITHEDMDEKLAYQIVKNVSKEHLKEFKQCHDKAKNLTTKDMFQGMSIPWHPGAAKFWREQGYLD